MTTQILYPGLDNPKEFPGALEALEYVAAHGHLGNFLIKDRNEPWQDGPTLFKKFQEFFAPVEE